MEATVLTFISIIHVLIALILIVMVLVQDSKGGLGALSGGSSNTVLGAGGAENILAKATRWLAILFAASCIFLSIYYSKGEKSVVDDYVPTATQQEQGVEALPTTENKEAAPAASPEQ